MAVPYKRECPSRGHALLRFPSACTGWWMSLWAQTALGKLSSSPKCTGQEQKLLHSILCVYQQRCWTHLWPHALVTPLQSADIFGLLILIPLLWRFARWNAEYPHRGCIFKYQVSVCKISFSSNACKVQEIPVNIIFVVWREEWTPPVTWVSARLDYLTETVVSVWAVGYIFIWLHFDFSFKKLTSMFGTSDVGVDNSVCLRACAC